MTTATEADLERAQQSMRYWDGRADEYSARAAEMRRTARELDAAASTLDRVLAPVQNLHVTSTWEGNAATQSRLRLDAHHDRLTTAIRTIDLLIGDLESEATTASVRASNASDEYTRYRQRVGRIEVELGALDDFHG